MAKMHRKQTWKRHSRRFGKVARRGVNASLIVSVRTHLLGLGLIRGRVPFLDLLGRMRDLPGRLSELLLCARLRHRDVGREWLLVEGNWLAVGDVELVNQNPLCAKMEDSFWWVYRALWVPQKSGRYLCGLGHISMAQPHLHSYSREVGT